MRLSLHHRDRQRGGGIKASELLSGLSPGSPAFPGLGTTPILFWAEVGTFDFRSPLEEKPYPSKGSAADLIHIAQSQEGVQQQSGIGNHKRHSYPSSKGRASFLHSQKNTCLAAETAKCEPRAGVPDKSFSTACVCGGRVLFPSTVWELQARSRGNRDLRQRPLDWVPGQGNGHQKERKESGERVPGWEGVLSSLCSLCCRKARWQEETMQGPGM